MDDMKYEDITEIDTSKRIKHNKKEAEMKRKEKFSLFNYFSIRLYDNGYGYRIL